MEYEDRIVIPSPEGVAVDYVLAGIGSRFLSELIDWLLRLAVLGALVGVLLATGGGEVQGIIFLIAAFAATFAYDIVFEVWGGGRTPAKRWNGLRVVRVGGQPVTFGPSAVRNLLRIVDEPLTLFLGAVISITITERNQRLGDLAAGTIVIREPRLDAHTESRPAWSPRPGSAAAAGASGLDLTGLTPAELGAVRDFLARRGELTAAARTRVAQALADAIAPKVGGLPPDDRTPEWILETIASARRDG